MYARELHDDRDATRVFLEHLGRDAEYVGAKTRASIGWNNGNAHQ
jgi:hypothetical protein